jgi:competence protein ComGC
MIVLETILGIIGFLIITIVSINLIVFIYNLFKHQDK